MRKLDFGVAAVGIAVIGIALFVPIILRAQQETTVPVVIQMSDISGAGIPRAQVRVVPAPDKPPAKMETDAQGHLSLDLKPGGYALFVSAQGFRKDTRHVDIGTPDRASAAQIVSVVLSPDSGGGVTVFPTAVEGSLLPSAYPYHAPALISLADFRALPHITVKVNNGHTNTAETYSGVPLATLLEKVNAPLGKELRGEVMTNYVIASGSDGYSVVLSLAEVDPNFREAQVLVADMREGQPLGGSGPFQLIVPGDERPARWVRNLTSITLQRAP
jgi:hypothetical protein